ncbi:hypothetical protein BC351_25040 [Paenibacillus ferrarius]|uniref:Uncharacterized protein n=1 Tax=Paenibacillus ferrarius TaxID=1469647 RepID=A0A1V4HJ52_9BACL|nr:hypothetical protein BC351_25040 [Paenibacillus ferrarius]
MRDDIISSLLETAELKILTFDIHHRNEMNYRNKVLQEFYMMTYVGDCPHMEAPPCLTCNGGSPCKDLAIGFSELDVPIQSCRHSAADRLLAPAAVRNTYSKANKARDK